MEYDTPLIVLVSPNGYRGNKARICKCGEQRPNTYGGRIMVVVVGIDVSKATLDMMLLDRLRFS